MVQMQFRFFFYFFITRLKAIIVTNVFTHRGQYANVIWFRIDYECVIRNNKAHRDLMLAISAHFIREK